MSGKGIKTQIYSRLPLLSNGVEQMAKLSYEIFNVYTNFFFHFLIFPFFFITFYIIILNDVILLCSEDEKTQSESFSYYCQHIL